MTIFAIDHVQLAMPPGEEEKARAFENADQHHGLSGKIARDLLSHFSDTRGDLFLANQDFGHGAL